MCYGMRTPRDHVGSHPDNYPIIRTIHIPTVELLLIIDVRPYALVNRAMAL